MTTAEVRRIRADEWAELRALRLAALRDTPLAFGSTYERELAFTPDQWRRWAADAATGAEYIAVAADGPRWVAMARGSDDEEIRARRSSRPCSSHRSGAGASWAAP